MTEKSHLYPSSQSAARAMEHVSLDEGREAGVGAAQDAQPGFLSAGRSELGLAVVSSSSSSSTQQQSQQQQQQQQEGLASSTTGAPISAAPQSSSSLRNSSHAGTTVHEGAQQQQQQQQHESARRWPHGLSGDAIRTKLFNSMSLWNVTLLCLASFFLCEFAKTPRQCCVNSVV
jgi:hypothetical protein